MFDPTIFDNLKVVIEGEVYDLDSVGMIRVTNRIDRVDLSTMSRYYAIQFYEQEETAGQTFAEIRLHAGTEDLVAEILEEEDRFTGCKLELFFQCYVKDVNRECLEIHQILDKIWENRPKIVQQLSFHYNDDTKIYTNEISLEFGRKINEDQIGDMGTLIDHVLHSIQCLNERTYEEKGD